jgi:uncharacterized protein YciI
MFVILINYKVSFKTIENSLAEHRIYLENCYQKNFFIVAGARNPRIGGLIISQLNNKNFLEKIIKKDPFVVKDLVSYEIIEFNPVKYHPDFSVFMNTEKVS